MEKMYPFSAAKHAHDIEFRRNRVKNEIGDYYLGELELSNVEFAALCDLEVALDELLLAILSSSDGRICYLTGKQIALAKQCVGWAASARSR